MGQIPIRALVVATLLTLAFAAGANPQNTNAPQPGLLKPVGTAIIPATTIPFVARNWFIASTEKNARVNISFLGDAFKAQFLAKVEPPHTGSTLRCASLANSPANGLIIKELGGEEKAETTLAELFSLMKAQKKGENGPPLTNGYGNVFYIKDVDGHSPCGPHPMALVPPNYDDGWYVNAGAITEPRGNLGVGRVCYRDSRAFTAGVNAQNTNAPQPGLLIPVGTAIIPATTIRFAARNWFMKKQPAEGAADDRVLAVAAPEYLSQRTVKHCRDVLRAALNVAMKWNLVSRNAAALATVTNPRKARPQFYDESQARVFLEAISGDRLEALFWLALCLGPREGELLGLQWTDFDFEKRNRNNPALVAPDPARGREEKPFGVASNEDGRQREEYSCA